MGPTLQRLTRESMQLNASMNNTIAERFNVGGALVVKLFGTPRPGVATRSPTAPGGCATSACRRRCTRACSSSRSASSPPSAPRSSTSSAATSRSPAPSASAPSPRSRSTSSQIYQPLTQLANARVDVLTALVSFERVFEVLDFPPLIADRPGAVRPRRAGRAGRVRPRVVPPPVGRGVVDRVARGGDRRHRHRGERLDPARRELHRRAGRARGAGRAVGRGQDHQRAARAPHPRRQRGRRCASTGTTCATTRSSRCATPSAW